MLRPTMIDEDRRPLDAGEQTEPRPRGHCYDAEKCNSDTFCECPCRTCTRTKRGEGASYETRA